MVIPMTHLYNTTIHTTNAHKMLRTSLKSKTSVAISALVIAVASLFALGPTLENQQALSLVYAHGYVHVVVVHHPYHGHMVVVHHY
jgi:hypothetical protein